MRSIVTSIVMYYPHSSKYYNISNVDTMLAYKIGVALNVIGLTCVVLVWAIAIASLGMSTCRGTFCRTWCLRSVPLFDFSGQGS